MVAVIATFGMGLVLGPAGLGDRGVSATSAADYRPTSEECRALGEINAFRKANGRQPLVLSATLGAAAEHHSQDMARRNYFRHNLSKRVSWSDNIRKHGYDGSPLAENIAAGNAGAVATVRQWINSEGHRRTMLRGDLKAIGIGAARDDGSRYGWYWTTTFGGATDGGAGC